MLFYQLLVTAISLPETTKSSSLGGALSKLLSSAKKVVPRADNSLVFKALAAAGISKAESQLDTDKQDDLVQRVISTLVTARLDTFYFNGMCFRNYTQNCPVGWSDCTNPSQDDSLPSTCASFPSQGATNTMKAEFALRCKADWPCGACIRDFSDCPSDFKQVQEGTKGFCKPKFPEYRGPCSEQIDFRRTTDTKEKARWAARCETTWPCFPE